MTHDEKVAYLLKDLRQKGVGQYTVAPPIYRLLWRLGVEVKPPHFASFWSLVVTTGVPFGVFWGIFMWALVWRQSTPVGFAGGVAALAGLLFGLVMAAYFRRRARKLALPRWENYPVS
jgi:membrane associated rhomboid family serine protease